MNSKASIIHTKEPDYSLWQLIWREKKTCLGIIVTALLSAFWMTQKRTSTYSSKAVVTAPSLAVNTLLETQLQELSFKFSKTPTIPPLKPFSLFLGQLESPSTAIEFFQQKEGKSSATRALLFHNNMLINIENNTAYLKISWPSEKLDLQDLFSEFLLYADKKAKQEALEQMQALISSKKDELQNILDGIQKNIPFKRQQLLEKLEEAKKIAQVSQIKQPKITSPSLGEQIQHSLTDNFYPLFPIAQLGYEALDREIEFLKKKNVDETTLTGIHELQDQISALDSYKLPVLDEVKFYEIGLAPSTPTFDVKNHPGLIFIIAFLLGGILSLIVVSVKSRTWHF